jgi:DNA invertase Pin-like site-specific DNA recombinase
MLKAISYIRFSSAIQGEGSSTERQEILVRKWLEKNPDYKLSNLSAKDLGRSGFSGAHLKHGLGGILSAIESKKITQGDVLLVEAFDRLGRLVPLEMMSLIQTIVSNGIKVITLQDQQEYSKDRLNSDASSLFILVGKVQQAHDFSKNLGERISASYDIKRRKAKAGGKIVIATPFWLNTDGTIKHREGEAVKECVTRFLKGRGTRKVLLELIDEYPELRNTHPTTLKRWFKNRALIGEWENKGDRIRNVFSPLIDEPTFYRLQNELVVRAVKMAPEETYGVSGIVVCEECGARFHFRRKKHNDYVIIYGNCSVYLKRGKPHCGNNKTWPYEVLDFIFKNTYRLSLLAVTSEGVADQRIEELMVLKAKKDEFEKSIQILLELLVKVPSQKQTMDKILELEHEKITVENKISVLENNVAKDKESLNDFRGKSVHKLKDIESDQIYLREVLKRFGYKIVVKGQYAKVELGIQLRQNKQFSDAWHPGKHIFDKWPTPTFHLDKRSTRYGCYILKMDNGTVLNSKLDMLDLGTGETYNVDYVAVSRTGIIATAKTKELLLENLESCIKKTAVI